MYFNRFSYSTGSIVFWSKTYQKELMEIPRTSNSIYKANFTFNGIGIQFYNIFSNLNVITKAGGRTIFTYPESFNFAPIRAILRTYKLECVSWLPIKPQPTEKHLNLVISIGRNVRWHPPEKAKIGLMRSDRCRMRWNPRVVLLGLLLFWDQFRSSLSLKNSKLTKPWKEMIA